MSDTPKRGQQNPSRVRDHLANERTYLAWMRSAIALMGFGVVIVRLRYFQIPELPHPSRSWKLGLLFSLVGLITVFLSTVYYFIIRRTIDDERYEPSTRRVIFFSISIALLGSWVIYYLFAVTANSTSFLTPE